VFALRNLDYKYIVRTEAQDELYDLRADPLEATNLAGRGSPARARLDRLAREAFAQAEREGSRAAARPASPEAEEELRALGYVQ
jgi:arylsulfatase A-like enzyme